PGSPEPPLRNSYRTRQVSSTYAPERRHGSTVLGLRARHDLLPMACPYHRSNALHEGTPAWTRPRVETEHTHSAAHSRSTTCKTPDPRTRRTDFRRPTGHPVRPSPCASGYFCTVVQFLFDLARLTSRQIRPLRCDSAKFRSRQCIDFRNIDQRLNLY